MKPQTKRDRAALARAAKAYIRAHYADPDLDLVITAAAVGTSPRHLQRVMGEAGEPFRDYLLRVRTTRAITLLRRGVVAHKVAGQVGYRGASGLRVALRRATGYTATAFQSKPPEYLGTVTFGQSGDSEPSAR
jgi:AraC-like DNA-binding protein